MTAMFLWQTLPDRPALGHAGEAGMQPDTVGEFHNNSYGCAHAGGFNMAFGDGRIETFGFDIDPGVHRALAGRANGILPVMD